MSRPLEVWPAPDRSNVTSVSGRSGDRVLHYMGTNFGMTGVETFILQLMAAQQRAGLSPSITLELEQREEVRTRARALGVPVHDFPEPVAVPAWLGRKAATARLRARRIRRLVELLADADTLHMHSVGIVGLDALVAASITRTPVIVTHHTTLSWFAPQRTLTSDVTFWLEKHLARYVVMPYASAARELIDRGVLSDRVVVVPFCVDEKRFAQRVGLPNGELRLAMAARMFRGKGHVELLEAVAAVRERHPRLRVMFLGDGPERERVEREVERLDLAGVVEVHGHVAHADVPARLASAHVIVLPSYMSGETFPVSLLEGMALGLPAIGTRWFGIPDIVADGETGFVVEPRDTQSLAAAIDRLASDADLYSDMSRRAAERVGAHFTATAVAARYGELYERARTTPATTALPGLHVERLGRPEDLWALTEEWETLLADVTPRTPFHTPRYNRLWWEHFGARGLALHDHFFGHVVRDGKGRLIAVAPMLLTHRPGVGPLRVRVLQFFGADANITEIRGLICRPAHERAALEALSANFEQGRPAWDWIDWRGIRQTDLLGDVLTNQTGCINEGPSVSDYCLELPDSWDRFRAGLQRNIKESIRKCYNSLKRDGHDFAFRVVSDAAEARPALERFFELHGRRARQTDTVAHRDVFSGAKARAFITAYARSVAEAGALRIFQLEIGGLVVATRVGFVFGDELYLYFSGYDPAWGKYSVMTTVVVETIKWAIARGIRVVNLSPGTDVSKLRWGPTETRYRSVQQIAPTLRARVSYDAYRGVVARSKASPRLGALLTALQRGK